MQQPNDLPEFQKEQQQTNHIRELMVCIHTQVAICGEVMTALNSAKEIELAAIKQYHVSHLAKFE